MLNPDEHDVQQQRDNAYDAGDRFEAATEVPPYAFAGEQPAEHDDPQTVQYSQVFASAGELKVEPSAPPDVRFWHRPEEWADFLEEQKQQLQIITRRARRRREGRRFKKRYRAEFLKDGNTPSRRMALEAFHQVKVEETESSETFAKKIGINENTVRDWISQVEHVAYRVGFDLVEDKLVMVGEKSPATKRLRELTRRDAGSEQAFTEWKRLSASCSTDPSWYNCGCHIQRARGDLLESIRLGEKGLVYASSSEDRALLLNSLGQTYIEPDFPDSSRAELAEHFWRMAKNQDPAQWFAPVNLAEKAVKERDFRRARYWLREVGYARKNMAAKAKRDLARYLADAAWTKELREMSFWKKGPQRWIKALTRSGVVSVIVLLLMGVIGGAGGV